MNDKPRKFTFGIEAVTTAVIPMLNDEDLERAFGALAIEMHRRGKIENTVLDLARAAGRAINHEKLPP